MTGADWPYRASNIGWVARCANGCRGFTADVPTVNCNGQPVTLRLCRACQDRLIKLLRAAIPRHDTIR